MTQQTSPVRRMSLEAAWAWLDSQAFAPTEQTVSTDTSLVGRVLARDVLAETGLPLHDMAVVDGFAVRVDDVLGANDYNLIRLALSDDTAAPTVGRAAPVVSGRSVPAGFDTILPVDSVERLAGAIEVAAAVPRGNGIVQKGQASPDGALLLAAGSRLSAVDVLLLKEAGCKAVSLQRRPKVALLAFGGKDGRDTSSATLSQLMKRDGADVEQESGEALALAAERWSEVDLIVVTGRSGWGDDDVAENLICRYGALDHHGLALRPCTSLGLGHLGDVPLILLPGDPLSSWVGYELMAARVLRRWTSRSPLLAYPSGRRVLTRKIRSPVGMADWVPLAIEGDGRVTPLPIPAACPLSAVAHADAFTLIPAASEGVASGDSITIHPLTTRHEAEP